MANILLCDDEKDIVLFLKDLSMLNVLVFLRQIFPLASTMFFSPVMPSKIATANFDSFIFSESSSINPLT